MADFMGVPYPIRKTAKGFLYTQSGTNQIKSDLLQLLLTNPGDRVMLPTYGTPLRALLFQPNTSVLTETIKQAISNAISQWEPRIVVKSIDVQNNATQASLPATDPRQNLENFLSVKIRFATFNNIDVVEDLVLQIPIGEG